MENKYLYSGLAGGLASAVSIAAPELVERVLSMDPETVRNFGLGVAAATLGVNYAVPAAKFVLDQTVGRAYHAVRGAVRKR